MTTTTKKPSIDERMADVKREILLCNGLRDVPEIVPTWSIINIAALLIIIARQERDEALTLADALLQAGQRT